MQPQVRLQSATAALDRVVDVPGMRELERGAGPNLMARAGAALAAAVRRRAGPLRGRSVVLLIGPGDNGGDALIVARHLSRDGAAVTCWGSRERPADPLLSAARAAGARWRVWDGRPARLQRDIHDAAVLIDGLLGIGSRPPLRGEIAAVLAAVPLAPGQPRIAIDIPSGTDGDAGTADPHAFVAGHTLSTGPIKLGTLLHPAIEHAGEVEALDIAFDPSALKRLPLRLIHELTVRTLLPGRAPAAHKGDFGRALIVGGSTRYRGAPALAARAALATGTGLVTVAAVEAALGPAALHAPGATFLPLDQSPAGTLSADLGALEEVLDRATALLIGPGLGRGPAGDTLTIDVLKHRAPGRPCAVDADGLNALADVRSAWPPLGPEVVLTPHPGELGRLMGLDRAPVGRARLQAAQDLAVATGATVVAKGSPTFVCAGADVGILAQPNPVLAAAGSGDVLAGTIVGLLAQGAEPAAAARLGVWLHAEAGRLAAGSADRGVPMERVAARLTPALTTLLS